MRMYVTSPAATILLLLFQVCAPMPGDAAAPGEKTIRLAHVEVTATGVSDAYANAIA